MSQMNDMAGRSIGCMPLGVRVVGVYVDVSITANTSHALGEHSD